LSDLKGTETQISREEKVLYIYASRFLSPPKL